MYIDLPLGLGMALAQNEYAMQKFESMSDKEKQLIIDKAHHVKSKAEMRSLLNSLI